MALALEPTNYEQFVREYERKRPVFESYTKKLKGLLKELVIKEKISYHMVSGRTKSVKSLGKNFSLRKKLFRSLETSY